MKKTAELSNKRDRGAGLVEYVLLLMLIAILSIAAMRGFGFQVSTRFSAFSSTWNAYSAH